MRIAIDYNVDRDEISLMCEVEDNSCAESCINFVTHKAESVAVQFDRGGTSVESVLPVEHCSACYVLPDAHMRAAGEFTVCADGCTPLRFIVETEIPADVEYSVSMHANGTFYVRYASTGGGGDTTGMFAFEIDENGHLLCIYDGSNPPPLSIDENGHLIWTLEG